MKRRALGGLCAERLETQVAADSSAFLMCESARNMERMRFWVDDDISVSGANGHGGLGEAYLKFVTIGRLMKLPDALNFRVAQVELEIPFTKSKSIWIRSYDIYIQSNVGVVNPAFKQQLVNNAFTFPGSGKAIEFSGGRHAGGYNYSIGFINQNTSGTAQAMTNNYVPTATGSNFGGLGVASVANFKDIYTSFNYLSNLEKDKESRNAIQAAGPAGLRDHTYCELRYVLVLWTLSAAFDGNATRHLCHTDRTRAVLSGGWQLHFQQSLLRADQRPLHVWPRLQPAARGRDRSFNSIAGERGCTGRLCSRFAFHLKRRLCRRRMAGLSLDVRDNSLRRGQLDSDYYNALVPGGFTGSPFNGAASVTRNRITPAVQFLIHANIKPTAETRFRPSQSVEFALNPITGVPMAVNSFQTNTLVLGLDFV